MNYSEPIQVPAMMLWDIQVGDHRHVSIADASADMVKLTALALSSAYPEKDVRVVTGLRIRYWFRAGSEVVVAPGVEAEARCPYQSSHYKMCWELGQTFPVEAWVDVKQCGTKSIL